MVLKISFVNASRLPYPSAGALPSERYEFRPNITVRTGSTAFPNALVYAPPPLSCSSSAVLKVPTSASIGTLQSCPLLFCPMSTHVVTER